MNQLCLDLQPTDPSYRLIYLTQGQVTLVDTEDYEWISQWKWRAKRNPRSGNFYAVRGVNNHYFKGKYASDGKFDPEYQHGNNA